MRKLGLLLLCTCAAAASIAQDVPELGPSAELKKLDWMVGDWKAANTDFTVMGQAMKMDATMSVSWEGMFMKAQTQQEFDVGVIFTELMMMGYDADSKKYKSSAYTNFSPEPRVGEGELKGSVLSIDNKPWRSPGGTSESRIKFTKKSDDKITFKLELKIEDGEWEDATEFDFERVKK
jgi:hypothetical protein